MALRIRICERRGSPHLTGRQRGFSYLLLLFAVAALGIASAGSALMWSTLSQTERERELLFIGGEFSRALQRYYDASPTEPRTYPTRLEDLLEDKRQAVTLRHLRKIYVDPVTGKADWGLVRVGGQIRAIHSLSEKNARIQVLPRWVDATGEGLSAKPAGTTVPAAGSGSAALPGATGRKALARAGELHHADWLFVPVAEAGAAGGARDGSAAGGTAAGGTGDGSASPVVPGWDRESPGGQGDGSNRSLQEQYMNGAPQ